MNPTNDLSPKLALYSKILLLVIILTTEVVATKSNISLKVYPLVDDILQKIFLLSFNSDTYYLAVSCKEKDMLSLSVSK
jgi:hypothetical protein